MGQEKFVISKHLVSQPFFIIIISCFTVVVLFIPVGTTHSEGHTIPVCDDFSYKVKDALVAVTKSKTLYVTVSLLETAMLLAR